MRYFLFLDESGDHGLKTVDSNFPVFILCGLLIREDRYSVINDAINKIKLTFWENENVILHSRDIRKCEKEFQILFDLNIKQEFYKQINNIVSDSDYTVIAAAIKKEDYIKKYGKQADNVYNIAISFIIERAVYCLDELKDDEVNIQMVIEKRGDKEDSILEKYFQMIKSLGTFYIEPERINKYKFGFHFRHKKNNVNGLQLADLIAYPIARYIIEPERLNKSFDMFKDKFYGGKKRFGLKIFP